MTKKQGRRNSKTSDMFTNLFKNIGAWLRNLWSKPAVKKILENWEKAYSQERILFVAELAASAAPLIQELKNRNDLNGQEKLNFVVGTLTTKFAKHALVLAGRVTISTLKDLSILAAQNQYVAEKLILEDSENKG